MVDKRKKTVAVKSIEIEISAMDVLDYLKGQLDLLKQQHKTYLPTDPLLKEDNRSEREKIEEMVIRRQISMMEQHIKAIEFMSGIRKK
jgi:hypothetical protein